MSYSRPSMIEIFRKELSPEAKSKINKKIIETLEDNPYSLSRIFDDCPCSLPLDEINTLTEEFKGLLAKIRFKAGISDLNELSLHTKEDKEAVDAWINKIVNFGIDQLLTSKGGLKSDFIDYFQLKKFQPYFRTSKFVSSILCGFTSRINQEVMHISSQEIDKNQHAYSALGNYLNDPNNNIENQKKPIDEKERPNNIKRIVTEAMNAKKFIFAPAPMTDKEKMQFKQMVHRSVEKPSNSSLMVLAAIAGGGVAASYFLFKEINKVQESKRHLPEVSSSSISRKLS